MKSSAHYCETCDLSFSSWKELKEHWMSVEHREKARDVLLRSEQLLNRIAKTFIELEEKKDRPV